jgi:hypothetical protein
MKKYILILTVCFALGCNKEQFFETATKNMHKSGSNSQIDDYDFTRYIEIEDYLPSTTEAIHLECKEIINAVNDGTVYRSRALNETMFVLEGAFNLDKANMPLPVKHFQREIVLLDMEVGTDTKITGQSIKNAYLAIKSKLDVIRGEKNHITLIDVEPYRLEGNRVKARAVVSYGEIELGLFPTNLGNEIPYGDMNFLQIPHNQAFGGLDCKNVDPLEHAANYLTGDLYTFLPGIHNANTFWCVNCGKLNEKWLGWHQNSIFSVVNVHSPHWPLTKTYAEYRDQVGLAPLNGTVNIRYFLDNTLGSSTLTFNPANQVKYQQLIGIETNNTFTIDPQSCANFENLMGETSSIYGTTRDEKTYVIEGPVSKTWLNTCITECQYNDYIDQYMSHLASVRNQLPPTGGQLIGCSVFEFKSSQLERHLVLKGGPSGPPKIPAAFGGFGHFLSPTYGKIVRDFD